MPEGSIVTIFHSTILATPCAKRRQINLCEKARTNPTSNESKDLEAALSRRAFCNVSSFVPSLLSRLSHSQVHRPRALIVDDEQSILSFAERALHEGGYDVAVAPDGDTALRIAEEQGPFDVFIIDVMMPQMTGVELGRRVRQSNPDVRVLYFTGFSDRLFDDKLALWEHEAFLEKPGSVAGLLEAVSLVLFGHTHGPAAL